MVMPEDRIAEGLVGHPTVRRLLVCNPYRSVAGKALATARRRPEPEFPTTADRRLLEPLRLRRTDPTLPLRTVARYERRVRRAAGRLGLERPAVISTHPLVAGFGGFEWAGSVTYYAWDDWTASVPHRRWWPAYRQAFARLRAVGRRVCAVSDRALDTIAPTGPHAVVPNGLAPAEWQRPGPAPAWFVARPRPRLLYVGSLGSRVDVWQAHSLAQAYPHGSLTFVGYWDEPGHFEPLRRLPNVSFETDVPRADITGVMAAADACLIPHVRNRLTEAMSPLKLYEYLAAGRPVAAVNLPPIAAVDGRVTLVPAGGNLVPAVAEALRMGPAPEAERLDFVRRNAWSERVDALLRLALAD
jgi:teichuronic acid biosynthesis glycosyltransferase TuaH